MKLRYNKEDEFLKSISGDDAVFHYTRRSTALERILFDDCFKFSSLVNANDPYEYKNKMIGAGGWSWDNAVEKKVDETCKVLDKLLEEKVSFISCCSNTIENNLLRSHGCLKSRMWSQYSENHEGICLALSKENLINLIREKYKEDMYSTYQGYVSYKEYVNENSGHNSIEINCDTFDNNTPIDVAIKHIDRYQRELLFRKQLDYGDEHEYRVIVLRKDYGVDATVIPEFEVSKCLIGVILGDRFPKVYTPAIDKLSKDMGFEYRKLHWESGEYFLLGNNAG